MTNAIEPTAFLEERDGLDINYYYELEQSLLSEYQEVVAFIQNRCVSKTNVILNAKTGGLLGVAGGFMKETHHIGVERNPECAQSYVKVAKAIGSNGYLHQQHQIEWSKGNLKRNFGKVEEPWDLSAPGISWIVDEAAPGSAVETALGRQKADTVTIVEPGAATSMYWEHPYPALPQFLINPIMHDRQIEVAHRLALSMDLLAAKLLRTGGMLVHGCRVPSMQVAMQLIAKAYTSSPYWEKSGGPGPDMLYIASKDEKPGNDFIIYGLQRNGVSTTEQN